MDDSDLVVVALIGIVLFESMHALKKIFIL